MVGPKQPMVPESNSILIPVSFWHLILYHSNFSFSFSFFLLGSIYGIIFWVGGAMFLFLVMICGYWHTVYGFLVRHAWHGIA